MGVHRVGAITSIPHREKEYSKLAKLSGSVYEHEQRDGGEGGAAERKDSHVYTALMKRLRGRGGGWWW